jgi:hypothetical protein
VGALKQNDAALQKNNIQVETNVNDLKKAETLRRILSPQPQQQADIVHEITRN